MFRVSGLRFGVWGFGFRAYGLGFRNGLQDKFCDTAVGETGGPVGGDTYLTEVILQKSILAKNPSIYLLSLLIQKPS